MFYMADESVYTCAVWYLNDHGQIDYELFKTEDEAARIAASLDGDGTVLGLQYPGGRTVRREEWHAFASEKEREEQRWRDLRENPPPPIPTRPAVDPFKGRPIDIETAEPDWLGA
jgi:hypothetical protein